MSDLIQGIAGERIEVGQMLAVGPDGKYYLAASSNRVQQIAPAAEPIEKDNVIQFDRGLWRPVNNPKK